MSDTIKRDNLTGSLKPSGTGTGGIAGGSSGKAVPPTRFRIGTVGSTLARPQARVESAHSGNGHSRSHSNGTEQPAEVRPVKVRLGQTGRLALDGNGHDGHNGHSGHGNGNGNGTARGSRALRDSVVVAAPHGTSRLTTSHLRETDLRGLRYRLGQQSPVLVPASSRRASVHRRDLPYFLMRHRALRSGARAGYTRGKLAAARYGKGGPGKLILGLGLASWLFMGLLFLSTIGAGVAGAAFYIGTMPPVDPAHLQDDISKYGVSVQTSKIYDRNGVLLDDLVDQATGRRTELSIDKISPLVISATIAAEDGTFWSNPGVDPVAIARAPLIALSGSGTSGASTITQQLVRQIVLSPTDLAGPAWQRKIKEIVLAVQLNQTYSKNDIMDMFLNQNYYGHLAYGIGAASLTYFGKKADDLTLGEASLLAGLPQAPTDYDPYVNKDLAKKRQGYVLDQMAKYNMITQQQADAAEAQDIVLTPYKVTIQAPHFVYYVRDYLEKMYGPTALEQGLKVYTTLDLRVEQAAEQIAKDRIADLQAQKATNASIVIMKPGTGEILAMVGSVDYYNTAIDGQVNVATAERQPGSSFKPITYVTAFEQGWTPATTILDTLTSFPNPGQAPYIPYNYDRKDHGWVTVRKALSNSFNIPAVKALQFAGIQNTIDTAHAMGIKGLNRGTGWYGLSLTLGGGEVTLLDMTNAYSTFANQGSEVDANPIMRIDDAYGRTIYQLDPNTKGNSVIDPRYTYMITDILSDNNARATEFGLDSPLKTSFPSAAKTGTTNDNRDSWTMGYTPELTVGVWVGNSDNAEMASVTGAIGAAVIWHNVMEKFYATPVFVDLLKGPDGSMQSKFVQPPGLIRASACSAGGTVTDLFLASAPPRGCVTYKDNDKQVHSYTAPSAPSYRNSNNNNNGPTNNAPRAKPTPIPGIGPPSFNP